MMVMPSAEHRPLKRQKLGPPDVYPQDAKQREDELDDLSVKQGFTHRPQIQDEYGSALNCTLNSAKVADNFNMILKKKAELNQLPDTGRKKQQINIKDNFWLVTLRSKTAIDAWFKDLAGSKLLTSLAKKVPIFPKREDMLLTLCEYAVPLQRAIWFIKMTSFYHESKVAESKIKKRQQPDLSQDMTLTLTRFLKEQLSKITEAYGASGAAPAGSTTPGGSTPGSSSTVPPGSTPPGSNTPGSSTPSSMPQPPHSSPHQGVGSSGGIINSPSCAQLNHNLRNWNYIVQVTLFMYQDGLLDRQELLDWVVESITRHRSSEQDSALRVVLPLGLQYLDEITNSEYLSRKLAYFSATKLNQMCLEAGYTPGATINISTSTSSGQGSNTNSSNTINGCVATSTSATASSVLGRGTVSGGGSSTGGNSSGSGNPGTPQPSGSSTGSGTSAAATSSSSTITTSPVTQGQSRTTVTSVTSGSSGPEINPALAATLEELRLSHQHRPIVFALSAFIQAVTLDCSTALVWNNGGEKRNSWLCGSPLDHLPCPPSQLPMPPRYNNQTIRAELQSMEEHLKQRSRSAENRWSLDKYGVDITGWTTNRVLAALDALDRHCFDRVDASNSLETLYCKIFASNKDALAENGGVAGSGGSAVGGGSGGGGSTPSSSIGSGNSVSGSAVGGSNSVAGSGGSSSTSSSSSGSGGNGSLVGGTWPECGDGWEDAVATTICEWAVTVQRCGEHRAVVAARLLERRQAWLLAQAEAGRPADAASSASTPYYSFQKLLLKFLDTQAPVFDDCRTSERSREFGNLVLLFSELVRHDVFSHDGYMCTLISRGDLTDPPTPLSPPLGGPCTDFKECPSLGPQESNPLDNIDEDLDKMLQNITKDAAEGGHDSPPHHDLASAALDDSLGGRGTQPSIGVSGAADADAHRKQQPRHLVYAQHFPLPSDDSYAHEINQRYVLLYGVGKARDEARHAVKKLTKEILKLFSKRFSIDVAEGGKVKKSSRGEFSFESLLSRFSLLSYFDQHVITNTVAVQVVEMVCGCGSSSSNYLPLLDHVAFLMDLMEAGLNIHGLLHLCCQLIKEVVDIEAVLCERQCLAGSYCPQLTLLVLGVLRKYNKCLLVSQDQTCLVFEGLLRLVKHITNPAECSSAERIVLSYLHALYTSCSFIKVKHQESFASTASRIRQTLCLSHAPSDGKFRRNPHVLEEYINNPKLRIDMMSVKQQLSEASNRYSFACSAVLAVVTAPSNTRLNDVAVLCAEMTACCNALSSEWLGILNVLCSSVSNPANSSGTNSSVPYNDVLAAVDLRDAQTAAAAHASLSVFTAVLIARDCFTFEELLNRVVVHSLKAAWNNGMGNPEVEPGARLSCHLLLRIFQSPDSAQPAQYSPGSPASSGGGGGAIAQRALPGVGGRATQRSVRLSCDRHLLVAARLSFSMEPVLAFLKAMLIVSDAMSGQSKSSPAAAVSSSISDILGTSYLGTTPLSDISGCSVDKAPLSDFARYALRQICSQDWVREICLKCPEKLCNNDNLLDSILTQSQAQRVLHSICHPEWSSSAAATGSSPPDQRTAITNILLDLDEWRLRISWLDLHLMYEQLRGSPADLSQWLENVAQAAIAVFCQAAPPVAGRPHHTANMGTCRHKLRAVNLIAPLISKLPKAVQGRVLKVSSQVLNAVTFGAYSSHKPPVVPQPGSMPGGGVVLTSAGLTSASSALNGLGIPSSVPVLGLGVVGSSSCSSPGTSSSSCNSAQIPVHSQRPFLHLMLMCLEAAQDDTLSDLLENLRMQLMQPVTLFKELGRNRGEVDPNKRKLMLEALRLRFGLIGGLFDVITCHCSNLIITDWAILLVQLVVSGVIDLTSNSELFSSVLDMVAALIHSTLVSEPGCDTREENKRHYYTLVKKIKKELGELNNVSLRLMRQLIPLPKVQVEVVVMEPWGSITDTKGNRHQDFDKDKKHGVQGAEKQKLSPWDLLEGHRSPAPLSWAWLAATRLTRKTIKYHDSHQLLRFHTHSETQQRPLSYFLEPLNLPPEDLEPVPEKQVLQLPCILKEEPKAPDTPSADHSPRGGRGRGGGANAGGKNPTSNRRRKPRAPPAVPPINQQTTMPMNFQATSYNNVGGGPVSGGLPQVSQWGNNYVPAPQQQPPQQPQQPQPYYQQLPPGGGGPPRYPVYSHSHSRNVIRQVLLERAAGCGGGMAGGGLVGSGQAPPPQQQASAGFGSMGPMMTSHQTGPMIRQQLRGAMAARPQATGMYPGGPAMQNTMGPRHPIQGQPGQMYNPGAGGPGGGQPVNTAPAAMAQYGSYQQNPMMGGASTGAMMGPGGYQQTSYQSSMMGLRQPGYLSQGQMVQRPPQYMQTTAGGGGLGMMSGGQAYARPTMGGMAGAAGSATSLGPTAGMGAGGGAGGSMVSGGSMVAGGGGAGDGGMMHHRMMMAPTTTTNTGQQQQQQQSQMMSHLQRSMSGPQQQQQGNAVQQQQQQQQTQQPGQQAQTGVPQAGQQPNQQAQRQTMMGQGRGYPQPPY